MKKLDTLFPFDFERILNLIPDLINTKGDGRNIEPPSNGILTDLEFANNKKNQTIAIADIGNNKVVVLIARLNANKKIELLGFGEEETKETVVKGIIFNALKFSKYLKVALDKASEQAGIIPTSLYAGISCVTQTYEHPEILIRKNKDTEISATDITTLESAIINTKYYDDNYVLYVAPQLFSVDDEPGIINPLRMLGTKLETTFKVITCPTICIKNLKKSLEVLNISLKGVYPSAITTCLSIIHDVELEEGVVVVDIGAGKTSITIYKNTKLIHVETICLGGNSITKDISEYVKIPFKCAEEIKITYSKATHQNINPDETIEVTLFKNHKKTVFVKDLAFVTQCRITEIIEMVDLVICSHIEKEQILAGVIFTGGTATIPLFKTLAKAVLDAPCFISSEAIPIFTNINSKNKKLLNNPIYSSALGVLKLGFEIKRN